MPAIPLAISEVFDAIFVPIRTASDAIPAIALPTAFSASKCVMEIMISSNYGNHNNYFAYCMRVEKIAPFLNHQRFQEFKSVLANIEYILYGSNLLLGLPKSCITAASLFLSSFSFSSDF